MRKGMATGGIRKRSPLQTEKTTWGGSGPSQGMRGIPCQLSKETLAAGECATGKAGPK